MRDAFPDGYCRFMQDNDPFMRDAFPDGYGKISTPNIHLVVPRSISYLVVFTGGKPLQNHRIGNLWHELKEFLRREIKPRTKDELMQGILSFWDTVDIAKCTKYIRHSEGFIPCY